jgi:hypothetical protein
MENNSAEPIKLRDTVRGKKHRFFDAQGVDELVSISMALAQELWVVKERQVALEQAAAKQGVVIQDAADELSAEQMAKLDAERAAFIDRIFFVLREQAESQESNDQPKS